jgi:hypothetical protein
MFLTDVVTCLAGDITQHQLPSASRIFDIPEIPNANFDLVKRAGRINYQVARQGNPVGGDSEGSVESKFISWEVVVERTILSPSGSLFKSTVAITDGPSDTLRRLWFASL